MKKQILLLDIIDYLIDNGNTTIWSYINSKKFFLCLINLLKIKNIQEVQIKLLNLIKKWGIKFEEQKNNISNFTDIYNRLKNNGIIIPEYNGPDYNIYFHKTEQYIDNSENNIINKEINKNAFYYLDYLKNILKEENFQHKYRRLVAYLLKMNENIKLANEYIDLNETEKLKELINELNEGNIILKDTITGGKLKDEKLMDLTLGTTDDIKQTIVRFDDLMKGNTEIQRFISYFEISNIIPKLINN